MNHDRSTTRPRSLRVSTNGEPINPLDKAFVSIPIARMTVSGMRYDKSRIGRYGGCRLCLARGALLERALSASAICCA